MKGSTTALLSLLAAAASIAVVGAQTHEAAPAASRSYDQLIGPLTAQQEAENAAYKKAHQGAAAPADPAAVAGLNGYANTAAAGVNGLDGALRAAMAPSCPDVGEKSCQTFTGGAATETLVPDGVTDIRTPGKETVLMNDPLLKEAPLQVACPKGADCGKALQFGQLLREQQALISDASDATERQAAALKGQAPPSGKGTLAMGAAGGSGAAGAAAGTKGAAHARAALASDAAESAGATAAAPVSRPDGEPPYRAPAALAEKVLSAASGMDRSFTQNGALSAAGAAGGPPGGLAASGPAAGGGAREGSPKVGGPTFDSLRRDINSSSQNGAIQALMNSQQDKK